MFSSLSTAIFGIVGVVAAIFALVASDLDKRRWLKYSIVAILLALSIYAMVASLLGIQPADGDDTIQAAVASTSLALSETSTVTLRETVAAEIKPTIDALQATNEAMAVAATASSTITTPVNVQVTPIESIPGNIYGYTIATTDTVVAQAELSLDSNGVADIGYRLTFIIPEAGRVSHGIGMKFSEEQDVSNFDYIEFASEFGTPATDFQILFRDITLEDRGIYLRNDPPADSGVTVTVVDGYRIVKIPLRYFAEVNMKVLEGVYFISGTTTITEAGEHSFTVRGIRFGRDE